MEKGNSAVFGHRALDGWRGRDVHAPSAGGLLCKAGEIYLCADGLRGGEGKEKGGDIWRFEKIVVNLQEDEKGMWKVNSGVTRWKKN